MPAIVASAIIAFFSTTIDDFAIMLVFFGQAQKMPDVRMGYLRVIVGETIGFSIVIVLSLFGLLLGLIVPQEYVDLVGILPLIVGFQKGYEQLEENGYLPSCSKCCSRFHSYCAKICCCFRCGCCSNDNDNDNENHQQFGFFSKSSNLPNKNDYLPISTDDNDGNEDITIRKYHGKTSDKTDNTLQTHINNNISHYNSANNTGIINNSLNKRNIQHHNYNGSNIHINNSTPSKSFVTDDLSEYTSHFQDSEIASVDDDHIRTVTIAHTYTSLTSTNNYHSTNNMDNSYNGNNNNNRYHHADDDDDEYTGEEYTLQYNSTYNNNNKGSSNGKHHHDSLGTGFLLNHDDDIIDSKNNDDSSTTAKGTSGWVADLIKISTTTWMDKFVVEIIIMTLVLSSDNIGIYISLFASFRAWEVLLAVVVFYILLVVNIIIALMLMRCQGMVDFIQKYSQIIVPPFLIFLGLYILSGSIIWSFRPWF